MQKANERIIKWSRWNNESDNRIRDGRDWEYTWAVQQEGDYINDNAHGINKLAHACGNWRGWFHLNREATDD